MVIERIQSCSHLKKSGKVCGGLPTRRYVECSQNRAPGLKNENLRLKEYFCRGVEWWSNGVRNAECGVGSWEEPVFIG